MDFTVTRSGDLGSQLTVGYTTVAGTAQPNVDFTPENGAVTFPYGSATATIGIPVFGTNAYKPAALNFSVQLTGVVSVVGAPVTMASNVDFTSGTQPVSVSVGDFNGDGKLDLAVVNAGDNNVSVLLNTTAPGAATPSFGSPQIFGVGTNPAFLADADLNGDGKLDLAVVNNDSAGTVSVLLNTTPTGATTVSFANHFDFAVGTHPTGLAIGDLNGDGVPDLAVVNHGDSTVSVLLNSTFPGNVAPAFTGQRPFATGTSPYAVAMADLNGDGKPDLVVTNGAAGSVSVLENTIASGATIPAFADKQDFNTGTTPSAVAVGDLNGDGAPDVVVANAGDNTVSVLLNTTTPGADTFSFAAKQDFQTEADPQALAIKDLNGDGKADVVIANAAAGSNSVSMLVNTTVPGSTTATFANQQKFSTGGGPTSVAVGDFNGDGEPDVVSANSASGANSVSVLFNTTPMVEATNVSSFSAAQITLSHSTRGAAVSDFNGDGKPDVVVGGLSAYSLTVMVNTTPPDATNATFNAPAAFAVPERALLVTTGDINGDGKPDLIATLSTNNQNNEICVLLNTTAPGSLTPSFSAPVVFNAGSNVQSVDVADINGDGKPDLLVTNYTNYVAVLLNTTAPGAAVPTFFSKKTFPVGGNPDSVTVGDLNGDGKPDMVVTNPNASTVTVFLNSTTPGSFSPSFAKQDLAVAQKPYYTAIGDLNGDGQPDLAVVGAGNFVSVLLNNTAPGATTASFSAVSKVPEQSGYNFIKIQDINGDGKPDMVATGYFTGKEVVMLNTTSPGGTVLTFSNQPIATLSRGTNFTAIGDLNGDGRPDFVVTNQNSNTFPIVINSPAAITTASATGTIEETAQFSAASETVNENGGTFSIPITLSLPSPVDTTIAFNVGGTAVSGTNYSGIISSPLVIPAGQTTGMITGTLLDNGVFDGNKLLTVTLGTLTNASLGNVTANTMTIQDSSTPPVVALASAAQLVNENDGTFSITVNLTGATQAVTTIPFTLSGTASANVNYKNVTPSPLVIPVGQSSATITGTLVDDGKFDSANKTLIFSLGTPTNATLGNISADTLTINETDPMPTVTFPNASQTVNESGGNFTRSRLPVHSVRHYYNYSVYAERHGGQRRELQWCNRLANRDSRRSDLHCHNG